ncbi:MAG: metallopeptidase TldD-related protein [Acidobacteriota bacterium]
MSPFADIDAAAVTRVLSQIADRADDLADAYFERSEVIELPGDDRPPGLRVRRETGLAVRLLRDGKTWLAGRDGIEVERFAEAVRRVARALPQNPYPPPHLGSARWDEAPEAQELLEFPTQVARALRERGSPVVARLSVRRHRRWVRVIGSLVASATERESFYSVVSETPFGRHGALFDRLDHDTCERLAASLASLGETADAESPKPGRSVCVLGPAATAVLLHEAVAHALEADILARGGHPEAAIGVRLGSDQLDVFDDPRNGPEGVRRRADDEGYPTVRRCLLRSGIIEQPICDAGWSRRSDLLVPGGGRRGHRHDPPGPRSSHLELAPKSAGTADLMRDGALYLGEASRGRLDPTTGELMLRFTHGRRIQDGAPGPVVGPLTLRGHVTDILERVDAVGTDVRTGGAGWCAKDGIRLPVWASAPGLRLDGVEVTP